MARILVTGGSGTLGRHVLAAEALAEHSLVSPSSSELDLRRPQGVLDQVATLRPALVIHCAARIRSRGTDSAEDRRAMSRVNIFGTGTLARAAEAAGARLVYVSTDFVFDGSKPGGMYTEQDTPCPLGYYPLTKFAGEQLALQHPDSLSVRLSFNETWPYPKAFTDRFTSKLPVAKAASQLAAAALSEARGVLHIGGPRQSYLEFARSLGANVQPMTMADLESVDPLPIDTSLNSNRWHAIHQRR